MAWLYVKSSAPAISSPDTTPSSAVRNLREETVEPRLYSRLLLRLLALPIAALTILALALGYGLERIQSSASAVDRADVVILHSNRLIKLMIDEETGLRGFLLTRNPVFLQPLDAANQQIESAVHSREGTDKLA